MQRKTVSLLVALLMLSAVPLNASADENDDIPTNASSTGVHDSLVAALAHADLVTTLQGDGPFTVFAPTDDAFAAAGIDLTTFDTDEENATLTDILLYHVYSGAVNAADVTDGLTVTMLNGDEASFTVTDDAVMIGDATVTTADVQSSNGVIHVIDKVLMPPADLVDIPTVASDTGIHTALVAALSKADLVTTLQGVGPFTVFAPTDQAFTDAGIDLDAFTTDEDIAVLADILLYHVYSGSVMADMVTDGMVVTMVNGDDASFTVSTDGTVMIGDATVTSADVMASNGVIHVIDKVLMPPTEVDPDIPTVASGTGVHTALVAAVVQAGLLETLQGDGPFTLFAPTDDAFVDAGIDLSDFETEEGLATLTDILLYHVALGAVTSDMLSDGMVVNMVNEDGVTFTINSDGVMVNDATVTMADVAASNGVIHVIDKVLMPPPAGEICYNMNTHTIVAGATQSECDAYMYVEDYEMNGESITGCYNGVTHAVSDVSQEICESYMWTPAVNIVNTASGTTIHNSLVAAITQAGLFTTLNGNDEYTVFAPTDEAFAAAGIDLDALDTPEGKEILANILLYHVVPGKIMSTDLADGQSNVTTANGDTLLIYVSDVLGVMVGDGLAMVTLADVPASNGVIHVIDKVLMPPADQVEQNETSSDNCDLTIGISSDGYAFSPASVTIDVGQTVCWKWTNESMAHNVKQVDGMKSDTFVDGGISSGEAAKTVDFQMTFTDDTTFYYACEPHVSVDMFGKITVGDGGIDSSDDDDDDDSENNTPGFLGVTMILATIGAVAFARSNRDEE